MHPIILSDIALQRRADMIRNAEEHRLTSQAKRALIAHREAARGLQKLRAWLSFARAASPPLPSVEEAPLFRGLPRRDLALLARKVDAVRFGAGAVLSRESEPRPEFLVITSGVAEASREGRRVAILCAGDHFGEQTVLDGAPDVPTITALTDVDAFVLGRRDFRDLLHRVPAVSVRLLSDMAEELRVIQRAPSHEHDKKGKQVARLD
jgi:signal-transduction protein with cAMP-binding, CBS, and nucleotidyltransferase domain